MSYTVYRIISPSGKSYIGITKNIKARWNAHTRCARMRTSPHPFYDAIRKYGAGSFSIEVLYETKFELDARAAEIKLIEIYQTTKRQHGYNVSPGGEYDGTTGSKLFWNRIRQDPPAFASYRHNLSEGCKRRGPTNLQALLESQSSLPPRERWYRAYRASRMSARSSSSREVKRGFTLSRERVEKMRVYGVAAWENQSASKKKRHSLTSKKNALSQWALRTDYEIKELSQKISKTLKARYQSDESLQSYNKEQLKSARAAIDRTKQASAASKGLKQFWAKLKSDPAQYAEYMSNRTASLISTLNGKRAAL